MADFHRAYSVSATQTSYSKKGVDAGGEVYSGIARLHYPDWRGWGRIDASREKSGFPSKLRRDRTLQKQVSAFYKESYWDRLMGDDLPDQSVANELYDMAVNFGVRRAVRILQSSLNLINRNKRNSSDLIVDGWFGPKTLATLKALQKKDRNRDALIKMMNIQQGAYCLEIMTGGSILERTIRGRTKLA